MLLLHNAEYTDIQYTVLCKRIIIFLLSFNYIDLLIKNNLVRLYITLNKKKI